MPERNVVNPILRGFNPDPSICRVDDDFYIATSTFEWYPGVRIHHSRDLRHWQLVTRALDNERLLNMLGEPDSCGVWAPCLSWSDGRFWLAYTDVRRFDGNFKDTHNYLTTATDIGGPWSDPVYLNSSGFDPSLFHAGDGRKWFLNMVWDHRPNRSFFNGIVMQEYDAERHCLAGEPTRIFSGTELGYTEGPHLYRIGEFYYLLTAEGGTGYGHAMTVARSRALHGPYEPDPAGPLVTTRERPDWPLQRTGHGDIVQLKDGSRFVVFLASRRCGESRHSPMGRETVLQPLDLTADGWLRLPHGDALPRVEIAAPDLPAFDVPPCIERDDFDEPALDIVYQWLRTPWPEQFHSLTERPGHLRLYGMESPGSWYTQALIARRQTHEVFVAETLLESDPADFQQMAGLILYYNASKFHYLYVSRDDTIGKYIGIMSCLADSSLAATFPIEDARVPLADARAVGLRMVVCHERLRFEWSAGGGESADWNTIPAELDVRVLTDQAGRTDGEQFTGTFVGLCAHDVSGRRAFADFDYFLVRPGN
ncbi:MAG: glycoside hydrolase family 43 protein [Pseudomonadota bacterium]